MGHFKIEFSKTAAKDYKKRRVTLSEYEAEMTNRQLLEVPLNL